jgi:thiosulfate/3-mercaptopyruvate sulfurtransferase
MEKLVEAKKNGDPTPLLDGRIAKYYQKAHIPTAVSLPLDHVMDGNYSFLPREEMIARFQSVGVKNPLTDEVVFCCQRGITACIIEHALRTLGNENTSVYDGSLEEWAQRTGMELPKEN